MMVKPNDERFVDAVEIWLDHMPAGSVPITDRQAVLYLTDMVAAFRRLQRENEQLETDKQELIERQQDQETDVATPRWP